MRPSGAISESSPSIGISAAKTMRKGAPFHGAIGEGRMASSATSLQMPGGTSARESVAESTTARNAPAIGSKTVVAVNRGAGDKFEPLFVSLDCYSCERSGRIMAKKHRRQNDRGSPQLQQHEPFLVIERAFVSGRCGRRMGRRLRQGPIT